MPDALKSEVVVKAFLMAAIARMGMRMLDMRTYTVEECVEKLGKAPAEDEGGVTGYAVLSTSHCAVHTWPLRNLAIIDCFSCRDFEVDGLVSLAERLFLTKTVRVHDLSISMLAEDAYGSVRL